MSSVRSLVRAVRDYAKNYNLAAGLTLSALVVAIVIGERFETARGTLQSLHQAESQEGVVEHAAPEWAWLVWGGMAFVGLVLGGLVAMRVIDLALAGAAADKRPRRRDVDDRARSRLQRLPALAWSAVGVWFVWQVMGAIAMKNDGDIGIRPALDVLAIVLAVAALAATGGYVVGGVQRAWAEASAVRIHLIVVGALFALVFLVPFSSGQLSDVLRAWGDGPFARPAAGIAGALLLGAVIRASAVRLLTPDPEGGPQVHLQVVAERAGRVMAPVQGAVRRAAPEGIGPWRRAGLALLAAAAVLVALCAAGMALAGLIAAIAIAIAAFTKWADPPPLEANDDHSRRALRRLAGTLSVVPLGTLLVGLVSATVDSFLLPSKATGEDVTLLLWTVAVAVLFGLLAGHAQAPSGEETKKLPRRNRWWGPAIGVLGFAGAVSPGVKPGLDQWVQGGITFLLLLFAVALAFRALGERGAPELWGGWGVAAGLTVAVYLEPIEAPRIVGTFAVALVVATGVLALLHAAVSLGERRAPRGLERVLPSRVPVVTLLLVWVGLAFVAASLDSRETAHQAREVDTAREPASLHSAVHAWLDREAAPRGGRRAPREVPMLMVAASGGGAKAAYWTDLVVDCIFGTDEPAAGNECPGTPESGGRFGRLFLTSSVSGGSVGIHHLVRQRHKLVSGQPWVDTHAGPEVLSPLTAWGLLHDLPAFMLGADTDPRECESNASCRRHADRALVQEAAVASFDHGEIVPPRDGGLLAASPEGPITIFNGALDGATGRVLMSPVRLAPPRYEDPGCPPQPTGEPAAGSIDGHDLLKPRKDIALVTAALLSARFPGMAPPGRLGDSKLLDERKPGEKRSCVPRLPLPPVHVRDGGYVENSGVLTIVELLPAITKAIDDWRRMGRGRDGIRVRPVVVSIDDDPAVVGGDPALTETKRESLGIAKRVGHAYLTRLARERLQSCQYPGVDYVRISPRPHVGAHAATGWEISETARQEDLAATLRRPDAPGADVAALREVVAGTNGPPAGANSWSVCP